LKRMGHRMHTTIHKAKDLSAIGFVKATNQYDMYAFHGSLLHKSPGNHSLYGFSSTMGPIWVLITSKDASSQRGHSALLSAL
jgi:hypothetical protein